MHKERKHLRQKSDIFPPKALQLSPGSRKRFRQKVFPGVHPLQSIPAAPSNPAGLNSPVSIRTMLLKTGTSKEQRCWKLGGHRGRSVQGGLLAPQRGTVVVLAEDEGRQDSSITSQPWAVSSSQLSPGQAFTKALGTNWENDLNSSKKLEWVRGEKEQKSQDVFKAGEAPSLEEPGACLLSSGMALHLPCFSWVLPAQTGPSKPPPWCQYRGFRAKVMIWSCTMKMFRSEKRWVIYKEIEPLSPCSALDFLREARVWFQDFGRHLCTRDMKTTEGREQKNKHVHWIPSIFAWWGCSTYKNFSKMAVN